MFALGKPSNNERQSIFIDGLLCAKNFSNIILRSQCFSKFIFLRSLLNAVSDLVGLEWGPGVVWWGWNYSVSLLSHGLHVSTHVFKFIERYTD